MGMSTGTAIAIAVYIGYVVTVVLVALGVLWHYKLLDEEDDEC